MRTLRYSINTTLDGCVDHRAGIPSQAIHLHHTAGIARLDAMLLGRVTYQMMEEAWRPVAETGVRPEWMDAWMVPFANTIHAVRKHVVSSTLPSVTWNAELLTGDLATAVRALKQQPGGTIGVGGVTLPLALAALDLIDEYEFVILPRIAGHGPRLLDTLPAHLDLQLTNEQHVDRDIIALTFRPASASSAVSASSA